MWLTYYMTIYICTVRSCTGACLHPDDPDLTCYFVSMVRWCESEFQSFLGPVKSPLNVYLCNGAIGLAGDSVWDSGKRAAGMNSSPGKIHPFLCWWRKPKRNGQQIFYYYLQDRINMGRHRFCGNVESQVSDDNQHFFYLLLDDFSFICYWMIFLYNYLLLNESLGPQQNPTCSAVYPD